jgi:hypothetical protein
VEQCYSRGNHPWDYENDMSMRTLFEFYKMFLMGSECLEDIYCNKVRQYKVLLEALDECPKCLTEVKTLYLEVLDVEEDEEVDELDEFYVIQVCFNRVFLVK